MTMTIRTACKKIAHTTYLYSGYTQLRNAIQAARKKSFITVLAYHRVDGPQGDVNAVSPENFERQMAFLRRNCRVITVAELVGTLRRGENCGRAVVITFDDGYLDNYLHAVPILRKYRLPACFFLSSGIVGTDRHFEHDLELAGRPLPVLSWDQVREIDALGFEIGSHTVNHARLSHCSPDELRREIRGSKSRLEEELGKRVEFFSFPFGKESDISPAALDEVKAAGFQCNFSSFGGVAAPDGDRFFIPRQGANDTDSMLYFRSCIEGWKIRARYGKTE